MDPNLQGSLNLASDSPVLMAATGAGADRASGGVERSALGVAPQVFRER